MLNIYTDENSEGVKVYSPDTEQINDIASIIDLIDEEGGYEGGCLIESGLTPKPDDNFSSKTLDYFEQEVYELAKNVLHVGFVKGSRKESTINEYIEVAKSRATFLEEDLFDDEKLVKILEAMAKIPNDYHPLYGNEYRCPFMPEDLPWSLDQFPSLLIHGQPEEMLFGINRSLSFVGGPGSFFGIHKEENDFHSINFLHWGAPKIWFVVDTDEDEKLEKAVRKACPALFEGKKDENGHVIEKGCETALRHKNVFLLPQFFEDNKIKYRKIVQKAGNLVVTFPKGYHQGINLGYNMAEAVNISTFRALDINIAAKSSCDKKTPACGNFYWMDIMQYLKNLQDYFWSSNDPKKDERIDELQLKIQKLAILQNPLMETASTSQQTQMSVTTPKQPEVARENPHYQHMHPNILVRSPEKKAVPPYKHSHPHPSVVPGRARDAAPRANFTIDDDFLQRVRQKRTK